MKDILRQSSVASVFLKVCRHGKHPLVVFPLLSPIPEACVRHPDVAVGRARDSRAMQVQQVILGIDSHDLEIQTFKVCKWVYTEICSIF